MILVNSRGLALQMETLVQLVHLNCQDMCYDSSNWMMLLAGSGLKMEVKQLKIEIVTALLICNASTLLCCLEMCKLIINKLKMHPIGMATFKKEEVEYNQKHN